MAFKNPSQLAQALTLANPTNPNATEPQIVAKPQRFSSRPQLENYGLTNDDYNKYKDAYYYYEPDDIDAEIADLKQKLADTNDTHSDFYANRLNVLSNDNLVKYLKDRAAYSKQFGGDVQEYSPTAKQAIINKILGNDDLYYTDKWDGKDWVTIDDLYDSINQDFAKKYGYDNSYYGDMFAPGDNHIRFSSVLGKEERDKENRINRRKYNKSAYLGELLRNGDLTLDELKKYIAEPYLKMLGGK